ncbi:MAG: GIY-YIG nuclease family protein [Bacteroidales bacterium]|nr:GIY-YIG nuclease family protein [Bacteroidales bacterium]
MKIDWPEFDYIHPRKNKFRKLAEIDNKSVQEQLQELNYKALLSNPTVKSGVYVFHSKADDFIYIGSAVNIEGRRQSHIDDLEKNQHINWMFQLTYHRHGLDNLSFYIMEFCPPKECLDMEHRLIYECDPEINIAGVRWSTLGLDLKSMNEQEQVREEWYQTKKGFEWKHRNVKYWKTSKVGREIIRQDMKNHWDRLSVANMTEDEKFTELCNHYKLYLSTKLLKKEILLEYINEIIPIKPIKKDKSTKPIKADKPLSKTQIKRQQKEKIDSGVSCFFIMLFLLAILFLWWLIS